MLVNNTPVELRMIGDLPAYVKREDLCSPLPGPSFSKLRGVYTHIKSRPEPVIGVLDTYHSKAGHAVSYVCHELGKDCINFWPRYAADIGQPLRPQQARSKAFGSQLVALPAGRSAILYHRAKKQMPPGSYIMPNALKLPESITENAAEMVRTVSELPYSGRLVISISSGTVAAGLIKGLYQTERLNDFEITLHMGYSRSIDQTRNYIKRVSGLDSEIDRVTFIDEGYNYKDRAKPGPECDFPINPYYDLKAYRWLLQPEQQMSFKDKPLVFWSIGD